MKKARIILAAALQPQNDNFRQRAGSPAGTAAWQERQLSGNGFRAHLNAENFAGNFDENAHSRFAAQKCDQSTYQKNSLGNIHINQYKQCISYSLMAPERDHKFIKAIPVRYRLTATFEALTVRLIRYFHMEIPKMNKISSVACTYAHRQGARRRQLLQLGF
ncbi:hypothetical protein [Collimonas humicola]|uniref:hypothetical protein n=1 Tax=Collimonas humicola TaxID=2825886 RepID=UPI001B8CBD59|nr:hypothetical protein [Collimonas humicola]